MWFAALLLAQGTNPVCTLNTAAVNESSGLAPSYLRSNTYYTHNDSGDTARFFRFGLDGAVDGIFSLQGVVALDWEDMATARVGRTGTPTVFLGDIGDNGRVRANIKIYRLPEPGGYSRTLTDFDTLTLVYPDGKHDCEALMVMPRSGDLWLVTKKGDGKSGVYSLSAPTASGTFTLQKRGELSLQGNSNFERQVTGGDISSDGRWIALRTYTKIHLWRITANWWTRPPRTIAAVPEIQGEAICFSSDSQKLYTSSEGNPCPINRVSWP